MSYRLCGIQQVGIGVSKVYEGFDWYKQHLGMDMMIFDEAAEAALMLPYTEGKPRSRHAVLALNYAGGGGLEIWQYTSREPQPSAFEIQYGDLGIFSIKFKAGSVAASSQRLKDHLVADMAINPGGKPHAWGRDPFGNYWELEEARDWYKEGFHHTGGVQGVTIGVSDIDHSVKFYREVLGYDVVTYDESGHHADLAGLPGGSEAYRRVKLQHAAAYKGPFAPLLGSTEIELVQALDRTPRKIFGDRMWGDLGYIHLCYDVRGMDGLKAACEEQGHPFTVDSADSFDMGEAAGRFAYCEDPDGTLIEFVEAHKISLLKKFGWYLDLTKRRDDQPLPWYIFKAMSFSRKK